MAIRSNGKTLELGSWCLISKTFLYLSMMIHLICRCFIGEILRYILIFTLLVIHCMNLIFVSHCFFQWGVKTSSGDRALWSSPLLLSYKLACYAVHNKMKTVPTHFDKTSSLQVYELTSELTNCSSVNIKTFFF